MDVTRRSTMLGALRLSRGLIDEGFVYILELEYYTNVRDMCYVFNPRTYRIGEYGSVDALGETIRDHEYLKSTEKLNPLGGKSTVLNTFYEFMYYNYPSYDNRYGVCISSELSGYYDPELCESIDKSYMDYLKEIKEEFKELEFKVRDDVYWGDDDSKLDSIVNTFGRLYESHGSVYKVLEYYKNHSVRVKQELSMLEYNILRHLNDLNHIALLIYNFNINYYMQYLSNESIVKRVVHSQSINSYMDKEVSDIVRFYDSLVYYWYDLMDMFGLSGELHSILGVDRYSVRDVVLEGGSSWV